MNAQSHYCPNCHDRFGNANALKASQDRSDEDSALCPNCIANGEKVELREGEDENELFRNILY